MPRHVWTAEYADLEIYKETATGELVSGGPLFTYCFAENITLSGKVETTRRPIPGRAQKKITNRAYEYNCSIAHLYFYKAQELDLANVFNRGQRLRLVFRLKDVSLQEDVHTISLAYATSFTINSQRNNNIQATATFDAELFT